MDYPFLLIGKLFTAKETNKELGNFSVVETEDESTLEGEQHLAIILQLKVLDKGMDLSLYLYLLSWFPFLMS